MVLNGSCKKIDDVRELFEGVLFAVYFIVLLYSMHIDDLLPKCWKLSYLL